MARAMRCEYHFVHQYCDPGAEPPSPAGAAGTAFHEYRAAYVNHLVAERMWQDIEWAYDYLDSHNVPEEARVIIQKDAGTFSINPEAVYGAELFLSVDKDFNLLESEFGLPQGSRGSSPHSMLSGTIDLLIIDGNEARVIDAKSAYSSSTISEEEASIYCCLVFAHFPRVDLVTFAWDFVRLGAHKSSTYGRDELPGMQQLVLDLVALRAEIAARVQDGDMLRTNAWSTMCPYCTLLCPELVNVERDTARLQPVQNEALARKIAGMIFLCERFVANARPLLKDFIAAREDLPDGQLRLGGNYIAEIATATTRKLPVLDVLHSLGLGVVNMTGLTDEQRKDLHAMEPAYSPAYDVPLRNLEMRGSALKGFAKTKQSRKRPDGGGVSREGLGAALEQISPLIASRASLRIRRVDQAIEAAVEETEAQ